MPEIIRHPDVHAPWSKWSEDQTLHIAVAYSNPFRWRTRRELMNRFRDHMSHQANVVLYVGELAYGDRPWEVTSPDNPLDIQLRTNSELFHKENLQNIVISRFPSDWKYGMACDADFHFVSVGWALEVIHQLQHYDWIQPFSSYMDVTSSSNYNQANLPMRVNSSFFFNYIQNGFKVSPQYHNAIIDKDGKTVKLVSGPDGYSSSMGMDKDDSSTFMRGCGSTGGAFAFTREAFNTVGGFLDRCILGHADWYMTHQLVGVEPPDIHSQKYHPNYQTYVKEWGIRAAKLKKNVGYADVFAMHFFHGSKTKRAYSSRDKILAEAHYDPLADVYPDWQGILQLSDDNIELRDNIRRYFISRAEDDPNLYASEKIMV